MSTDSSIQQLLQNHGIWKASDKCTLQPVLSTGYKILDDQLHYSGWPQGALSELLLQHNGIGEIRLLSPLLAQLSQQSGYITWINPPFLLNAPALADRGLQLNKIIIVQTNSVQESIWSAQQAMVSQACSAVLVWLPKKILATEIRKLSLAAKTGNCWGIIFRDQSLQLQSSSAALRIVLQSINGKQQLSIIKQSGGWAGQKLLLDLFPERVNWNALPVEHWPIFSPQKSNNTYLQLATTAEITPTSNFSDYFNDASNVHQRQSGNQLSKQSRVPQSAPSSFH